MFRRSWFGRVIAAGAATVAITAVVGGTPTAHADTFGGGSLTFVTFDPDSPLTVCTTTVDIDVDFANRPLVRETAIGTVHSTGCGSVSWGAMLILDDSSAPHLSWHTADASPRYGNPVTVTAVQDVPYGLVQRPSGVITVRFEANSRLGHVCAEARTEYDITWTERPLATYPCS